MIHARRWVDRLLTLLALAFLAAVLVGIGLLIRFGAQHGRPVVLPSTSAPVVSADVPNPVALVRKAGATPRPGSAVGEIALDDGLYAGGSFTPAYDESAETVFVYCYPTAEATQRALHQLPYPAGDDQHAIITGDRWFAEVVASGYIPPTKPYPVPAQTVADRLGGKVALR